MLFAFLLLSAQALAQQTCDQRFMGMNVTEICTALCSDFSPSDSFYVSAPVGTAGLPLALSIFPQSTCNTTLTTVSASDFRVIVTDQATGLSTTYPVVELTPGNFSSSYAIDIAGTYLVAVRQNTTASGDVLVGDPFVFTIAPAPEDVSNALVPAVGPFVVTAGVPFNFTFQIRDAFGNIVDPPQHFYTASLVANARRSASKRAGPVPVVPVGDGMLSVAFTETVSGTYTFSVSDTTAGQPIPGSPFTINVVAAAADPGRTQVSGAALTKARAGDPNWFKLTAYDAFNNRATVGGERWTVRLFSPAKNTSVGGVVKDDENGQYSCSYIPAFGGTQKLFISSAEGVAVGASPYTVSVKRSASEDSYIAWGIAMTVLLILLLICALCLCNRYRKSQKVMEIFKRGAGSDGVMDKAELAAFMERFKIPGNIDDVWSKVDRNGNGKVNFDEFMDWYVAQRPAGSTEMK